MTHRGLYFCAEENCIFAPEKWRGGFGLCLKHAISHGWITPQVKEVNAIRKQSLLNELLEEIAAGKIVELLPPVREIRCKFSIDGQPSDLPF